MDWLMTAFNVGDTVLLNEQHVVEITSWPAENEGFFGWVRFDKKDNSETRGLGWYGEVDGAPTTAADTLRLYVAAAGPVESTAGPLPEVEPESREDLIARLTAALAEAVGEPEDTAPEAVVEDDEPVVATEGDDVVDPVDDDAPEDEEGDVE